MLNRRRLLALLSAAAAHAHAAAQSRFFSRRPKSPPPPQTFTAFFATDTNHPAAQGIYAARFNTATGQFSPPVLAAACLRPAFLALSRGSLGGQPRTVLYATNEGDPHTSAVSAYLVTAGSTLTLLNRVPSAGEGPCYIAVHPTGRAAYIANYAGGSVTTFAIQPDGALSQPVDRIDFHPLGRNGPVAARQQAPHPHSATLSPDSRFLIVNDLGHDAIVIFPIHPEDPARLGPPNVVATRPGTGPRHVAFHPNGRWVYGVDELSNQVDQYLWNATRGGPGLEPQAILTNEGHTLSTLAPGYSAPNTAAEIALGTAGAFLYVSNRGENSLAAFAVDPATGALAPTQRISCGGRGPRHFTLDPTGRYLICGNQDSATVTVFARNETTGHLTGPIQTLPLEAPLYTLFLD